MAAEDDSFFSRWSRRKVQVRGGQPLPPDPAAPERPAADTRVDGTRVLSDATLPGPPDLSPPAPAVDAAPPAPTLDDVARLSSDSDFKPFVARHVPAEVRNAAVKKLFADPHFNVMDGLDIYIDDYSQPSPLSAAMMAKMVGAQFLKLVDDPNEVKPPVPGTATPDDQQATAPAAAPATSVEVPMAATEPEQPEPHDDHADLQLQPDHAPEPQGPGRGAG